MFQGLTLAVKLKMVVPVYFFVFELPQVVSLHSQIPIQVHCKDHNAKYGTDMVKYSSDCNAL